LKTVGEDYTVMYSSNVRCSQAVRVVDVADSTMREDMASPSLRGNHNMWAMHWMNYVIFDGTGDKNAGRETEGHLVACG